MQSQKKKKKKKSICHVKKIKSKKLYMWLILKRKLMYHSKLKVLMIKNPKIVHILIICFKICNILLLFEQGRSQHVLEGDIKFLKMQVFMVGRRRKFLCFRSAETVQFGTLSMISHAQILKHIFDTHNTQNLQVG